MSSSAGGPGAAGYPVVPEGGPKRALLGSRSATVPRFWLAEGFLVLLAEAPTHRDAAHPARRRFR